MPAYQDLRRKMRLPRHARPALVLLPLPPARTRRRAAEQPRGSSLPRALQPRRPRSHPARHHPRDHGPRRRPDRHQARRHPALWPPARLQQRERRRADRLQRIHRRGHPHRRGRRDGSRGFNLPPSARGNPRRHFAEGSGNDQSRSLRRICSRPGSPAD